MDYLANKDDIVAKALFYAGLVETEDSLSIPPDMRANGTAVLLDIVQSLGDSGLISAGESFKPFQVNVVDGIGYVTLNTTTLTDPTTNEVVVKEVCVGKEVLEPVSPKDFLTIYKGSKNVCTVLDGMNGNYVATWLDNTQTGIAVVTVKPTVSEVTSTETEGLKYYKLVATPQSLLYVQDYLAYRLASLYNVASKDNCKEMLLISGANVSKPHINAQSKSDPAQAINNLLHGKAVYGGRF